MGLPGPMLQGTTLPGWLWSSESGWWGWGLMWRCRRGSARPGRSAWFMLDVGNAGGKAAVEGWLLLLWEGNLAIGI